MAQITVKTNNDDFYSTLHNKMYNNAMDFDQHLGVSQDSSSLARKMGQMKSQKKS